jgi:hypothetical protein
MAVSLKKLMSIGGIYGKLRGDIMVRPNGRPNGTRRGPKKDGSGPRGGTANCPSTKK